MRVENSLQPKIHGRDLVMVIFIRQLPHAVENNLFWLIVSLFVVVVVAIVG